MIRIVKRAAEIFKLTMDQGGAVEIARRSRGTPRIANRWVKRVRDYAQVKSGGIVDEKIADYALTMLDVDSLGLDLLDKWYLRALIEQFNGGPVGLNNIAVAIGEDEGTIEDMVEPFLIQLGFVKRTRMGRMATVAACEHMRMAVPRTIESIPDDLFGDVQE